MYLFGRIIIINEFIICFYTLINYNSLVSSEHSLVAIESIENQRQVAITTAFLQYDEMQPLWNYFCLHLLFYMFTCCFGNKVGVSLNFENTKYVLA